MTELSDYKRLVEEPHLRKLEGTMRAQRTEIDRLRRAAGNSLRAFVYGIVVGIAMLIGAVSLASYIVGVKFQPVKVGVVPFGCDKNYVNNREDTGECS